MTDKEMQQKILTICKESTEKNPIVIFNRIVKKEDILIPIHGPIHHVVDGAAFMTAFFNAGGKINLEESFWELCNRAEKMPGGMCGHWGFVERLLLWLQVCLLLKKQAPFLSLIGEITFCIQARHWKSLEKLADLVVVKEMPI